MVPSLPNVRILEATTSTLTATLTLIWTAGLSVGSVEVWHLQDLLWQPPAGLGIPLLTSCVDRSSRTVQVVFRDYL